MAKNQEDFWLMFNMKFYYLFYLLTQKVLIRILIYVSTIQDYFNAGLNMMYFLI